MSVIKSPEQQTKISKRPFIQERVEKEESRLREARPYLNKKDINAFARSKVADRLKLEKVRNENAELIKKSEIDEMTGLITSEKFKKLLFLEMQRVKRRGKESVLVLLDLNNLKITNDTLGHEAGNKLIKQTANILREQTRSTDLLGHEMPSDSFVARWGGKSDEFYAVLSNTNYEGVEKWWERTNKEFEDQGIKISAGVTKITPEEEAEQVIQKSDLAMYRAKEISKKIGKNQLIKYDQVKPNE